MATGRRLGKCHEQTSKCSVGARGSTVGHICCVCRIAVALIEELSGNRAALEVMDYLETGQVIRLGARETLVLSYLNSCTRETITGGTVTVGTEQSEVVSGKVERTKVRCDRARASASAEYVIQSSGHVFRGLKN